MGGWALIFGSWGGGFYNAVPSVPGIEAALSAARCQFAAKQNHLHFSDDSERLQAAVSGQRTHYYGGESPLRWRVEET